MVIIMVNCITLAMYDPYDRECVTQKCQNLESIEAKPSHDPMLLQLHNG